jgi:hypothetical protein
MARVEIARLAREELAELIATRSLPADTEERVWRSLLTLEQFPLAGKALEGYWLGHRLVVGPWRWLLIVYRHAEDEDRVVVIGFRDGRSAGSVMNTGED